LKSAAQNVVIVIVFARPNLVLEVSGAEKKSGSEFPKFDHNLYNLDSENIAQ
jgi:hypothetical protein